MPAFLFDHHAVNRGIGLHCDLGIFSLRARTPASESCALVRPCRDGDVEAMLAIYRRYIRRGVEESVDDSARARRFARPA